MSDNRGQQQLLLLQKQWRQTALLTQIIWIVSALLIAALVWKYSSLLYATITFAALATVVMFFTRGSRFSIKNLVRYLNKTYPVLEESTQLLLPSAQLPSVVQQLQQNKVSEQLQKLHIRSPFRKPFYRAIIFFVLAILAFIAVQQWPVAKTNSSTTSEAITGGKKSKEIILASIQSASVIVTPPAYTRLSARRQQQFSLRAEAGAEVSWQLLMNAPAAHVSLQFNDGSSIPLQQSTAANTWQSSKTIRQSGFYQVKIDNRLSELYAIEAIKDAPPVITVQSPQPSLSLPYKGAQQFLWQSGVADDYGLVRLQLSATVASGQGEAVKFREQQIALPLQKGAKQQSVQHTLNCRALNMQPGDEVYLWLSATDNYGQESRSDVYVVSLQDTTGQITIDGLLTGLDVKPEFFRSQRQIIIETEQLLRNKNKMPVKQFQDKSNDLGIDQKLLRLRYGKFLGEEFIAEIGESHAEDGTHTEEKDEAAALMDLYSHKHDIAEDASYFDQATKNQLKAMLNEMWNAELKLRTMVPKDALPYEYKALRLLKDLQQKSRAYVPKTAFTPVPLQWNKRLSGDVSKVDNIFRQQKITAEDALLWMRKAISVLEEVKTSGQLTTNDVAILQPAYQQLLTKAALQPALYLEAIAGYRKVLSDDFRISDVRAAQKGLQLMLTPAAALPYPMKEAGNSLSQAYFENLRKSRR